MTSPRKLALAGFAVLTMLSPLISVPAGAAASQAGRTAHVASTRVAPKH
jgi:hypothetical protein